MILIVFLQERKEIFFFLTQILLVKKKQQLQLGEPFLSKGRIPCQIVEHLKGLKIRVLKTKPKKKYTRVLGHRQNYTRITTKFTM